MDYFCLCLLNKISQTLDLCFFSASDLQAMTVNLNKAAIKYKLKQKLLQNEKKYV